MTTPITIPVDDLPGLRELAQEWLGVRSLIWDNRGEAHWVRVGFKNSWFKLQRHGTNGKFCKPFIIPVLPLHIRSGYLLGVDYLAWKEPQLRGIFSHGAPHPEHVRQMLGHAGDELVTKLTAVYWCQECDGMGGENCLCPACAGTGKNPQRAALAMQACILYVVGER